MRDCRRRHLGGEGDRLQHGLRRQKARYRVVVVVVLVVVFAQSDGSVLTSVVEYDELGTGDVERAQFDASSPV